MKTESFKDLSKSVLSVLRESAQSQESLESYILREAAADDAAAAADAEQAAAAADAEQAAAAEAPAAEEPEAEVEAPEAEEAPTAKSNEKPKYVAQVSKDGEEAVLLLSKGQLEDLIHENGTKCVVKLYELGKEAKVPTVKVKM